MCRSDEDAYELYGCSLAEWDQLRLLGRKMWENGAPLRQLPLNGFCSQRTNAKRRGIGWELSLTEWWSIWERSGKWSKRGRSGYVMCRLKDAGSYRAGNVYIATASHNSRVQPNNPRRKAA